jgi:hypothetical protein
MSRKEDLEITNRLRQACGMKPIDKLPIIQHGENKRSNRKKRTREESEREEGGKRKSVHVYKKAIRELKFD